MSCKLIFCSQDSGHNIEYLHHIYTATIKDNNNNYVFIVPESFKKKSSVMEWETSNNIVFSYINVDSIIEGKVLHNAWILCSLLRRAIKKFKAENVVLISIINFMPFLPFFIPKGVSVSGIIYKIYLYTWKSSILKRKANDLLLMYIISKSRCLKKVFILNDSSSSVYLNKLWHTEKFTYLPDPYMPISLTNIHNLRCDLGISEDRQLVIHLGTLSSRKGTLTVLDMINNSNKEELQNYCFVFAGVILDDIRDRFAEMANKLSTKTQIIVIDDFLSFEKLASLVYSCDKVLLPYKRTDSSSGIIGYCAQFCKPVYVPNSGLLAKLVTRFKLGLIVNTFSTIRSIEMSINVSNCYCKCHKIEDFTDIILCNK